MAHIVATTNPAPIVKPKAAHNKPKVFRSYIGVKPYPESLNDFPADIIRVDDFHFILGFATEDNTGYFTVNWNTEYFGRDKVVSLKNKNPNAKVILSIGGRGHGYEFNAQEKLMWIGNAFRTIKGILEDYKVEDGPGHCGPYYTIDGIDINYEFVNPQVDVEVFSSCIGTLIKRLKHAKINVNVVSIAPSAISNRYYKQLYSEYSELIDYVCYQFYNEDMSTRNIEGLYNELIAEYSDGIVLAGGTTDPDNIRNLSPEDFLEGCKALISHGKLPGMFIWNANDSDTLDSDKRFKIEGMAQDLIKSCSIQPKPTYQTQIKNSLSPSNSSSQMAHKTPATTNLGIVKPKVFRSYIGVKPYPDRLNDFPAEIIKVDDFHFILGFATEDHKGKFTGKWNTEYFGNDKVVSLKNGKPKAKVMISIGGRGHDYEFNAQKPEIWIRNAFDTIKKILEDYKVKDGPDHSGPYYTIDGIDINYEFVNTKVGVQVFSNCIGRLIMKLKEINVTVVSIAPSANTNKHYKKLYSDYSDHIGYVCYQFYNEDMSGRNIEDLYNELIADYGAGIVLAGGTTDPDNIGNLSPEDFLEGCRALISHGKLPGMFIWNANDSDTLDSAERFKIERMAQDLILNTSSSE